MSRNSKYTLFCLVIFLLIPACAIKRPATDPSDVAKLGETTTVTTPMPGVTSEMDTTTVGEDIETIVEEAPDAPAADMVQQGRLLIKLVPASADKALESEIDGQSTGTETGTPALDELLTRIGATDIEPVMVDVANASNGDTEIMTDEAEETGQLYVVSIPPDLDPVEVANIVSQSSEVEYAEPNFIIGIAAEPVAIPERLTPNDPYYQYQWNMQAIQAPMAWDRATGKGVVVAIIDTGIDFKAPDFATTQHLTGYDFVNNDEDPTDDQGHGTHVAGTVAQSTNNSLGVAGVAYEAILLPIKALDNNGQGNYESIIKGIIYAVDQGAKVINLSLAGRNPSQALLDAVKYAHSKGVVVVVAAGNSNGPVQYPATYNQYVTSVGATTFDNQRARYSNFGQEIDIVAPGGDTQSDLNGDDFGDGIIQQTFRSDGSPGYSYRFFEGTSMASPHIAGVAALMFQLRPDATPDEIEAAMAQTATPLSIQEPFGAGLVQASKALEAIAGPGVPTTEPPTVEPPTTEPPTVEPPTVEPPTVEPPTVEPPTVEPPTVEPPTVEPPTVEPPTVEPPTVEPPTVEPPTVEPQIPQGSNLLTNGDFETDSSWTFGDTPVLAAYDSGIMHGGQRSIRLGDPARDWQSYTSIWQKTTIPAEATQAVLTVNIYPITEGCCGDLQQILILNDRFRVINTLMRELNNSQQWETRTYDLSDLRGQTIYVYIGVSNTGRVSNPTVMYVDDVSLTWN